MNKCAVIILFLSPMLLSQKDYRNNEEVINTLIREEAQKPKPKPKDADKTGTKQDSKSTSQEPEPKQKLDQKNEEAPKKETGGGKPKTLSTSAPDEALLKNGIQFYTSGLYPNAQKAFSELLIKIPQSPYRDQARVWLGKIHIALHDYDASLKELAAVPEDSGEYPAALFYTAENHKLKGEAINAIEEYQRLASRFPDNALADNALLNAADLYLNNQKGRQALDILMTMVKVYKERETIPDAYYLLGKLFEKDPEMKDFETARKIYQIFLKKSNAGQTHFKNSPLKEKVLKDLKNLEKKRYKS